MLTTIIFYATTIAYFLLTFWIAYKHRNRVKKEQEKVSNPTIYWFVYALLSAISYVLLLFILFWTVLLATHDWRERAFDAEKWKKEPKTRVLMIDDLMKRKMLDKKSRKEVINLLGSPESNDTVFNSFKSDLYREDSLRRNTDIIYELGAKNGVMQPDRFLEIWFENDSVLKYENR